MHYVADSETEQVEWFSALEGAVAKIVRAVAGLEEEEPAPAVDNLSSSSGRDRDWANQLEKGFASISKSSSSRPDSNAMVKIVGYSGGGSGGSYSGGGGGGGSSYPSAAWRSESFAADSGNYGGSISYGQIAGEASPLVNLLLPSVEQSSKTPRGASLLCLCKLALGLACLDWYH